MSGTAVGEEDRLARRDVLRAATGIGLYAGAFGMAFGATSVSAGLSLTQTMGLSLVMFTGASQFAFVGAIAAAGAPFAAVGPALLLGLRNAFYGVPLSAMLRPRGFAKLWTAHFVIDETTAMTVVRPTPELGRYAFWSTGLLLCGSWALGSLGGALLGKAVNPADFGLGAAAPAIFIALLYPQLRRPGAPVVAFVGAGLALALVPFVPAGVPVIAAAAVAICAGLTAVQLFGRTHHYGVNWPTLAGVAAGTVAMLAERSLLVVFIVAIAVTALLRLIA